MATLFKLGPRGYYASVNEFQGQIRIHIRKHTDFPDAEKVPTRYGVALTVPEFERLKNIIPDLSAMVNAMAETTSISTDPEDLAGIQNQQVIDPRATNLKLKGCAKRSQECKEDEPANKRKKSNKNSKSN